MLEPGKEIIKPMSAAEKITAVSPKDKNMPIVSIFSILSTLMKHLVILN